MQHSRTLHETLYGALAGPPYAAVARRHSLVAFDDGGDEATRYLRSLGEKEEEAVAGPIVALALLVHLAYCGAGEQRLRKSMVALAVASLFDHSLVCSSSGRPEEAGHL